jgi:hypothetical protein
MHSLLRTSVISRIAICYNHHMTKALQEAIARLQQMPEEQQDLLARLVLHEIGEDEKWLKSTSQNADKLRGLVNDVLTADARGECETLDPDQL